MSKSPVSLLFRPSHLGIVPRPPRRPTTPVASRTTSVHRRRVLESQGFDIRTAEALAQMWDASSHLSAKNTTTPVPATVRASLTFDQLRRLPFPIASAVYVARPTAGSELGTSRRDDNAPGGERMARNIVVDKAKDTIQVLMYLHHINSSPQLHDAQDNTQDSITDMQHIDFVRQAVANAYNVLCITKLGEPAFMYVRGESIDVKRFLIQVRKLRWQKLNLLSVSTVDQMVLEQSSPNVNPIADLALRNWEKNRSKSQRLNVSHDISGSPISYGELDDPCSQDMAHLPLFNNIPAAQTTDSNVDSKSDNEYEFQLNQINLAKFALDLEDYAREIASEDNVYADGDSESSDNKESVYDPLHKIRGNVVEKYLSQFEKDFKREMERLKFKNSLATLPSSVNSKTNAASLDVASSDTPKYPSLVSNLEPVASIHGEEIMPRRPGFTVDEALNEEMSREVPGESEHNDVGHGSSRIETGSKVKDESTHRIPMKQVRDVLERLTASGRRILLEKTPPMESAFVCVGGIAPTRDWEQLLRHFGALRAWKLVMKRKDPLQGAMRI